MEWLTAEQPRKMLLEKLLVLMEESLEKTSLLGEDDGGTEDFWLPRCNFDEQREALLEEYMRPPHSLSPGEVGTVLLEANQTMFPAEASKCKDALFHLNQSYELLRGYQLQLAYGYHDFLVLGCSTLTLLLQPSVSRINYIHADLMASTGALDLLLKLLIYPPVFSEDTIHRRQSVLCVMVNYAHAGQRHISAIVHHPCLMEAAVRVALGCELCPYAIERLCASQLDSLNLADDATWTKPVVSKLLLSGIRRSCLHFIYSVIDLPAAQVKVVACAMDLLVSVCINHSSQLQAPGKRSESLLDYALGCLLCCASNEQCLVPLLKSGIVERMITLLSGHNPPNEAYRACSVIAGIWRLLDKCRWREFLACELGRRFFNGLPPARLLPASDERELAHQTLKKYKTKMESALTTFLMLHTPDQISRYESIKAILWGRLTPFTLLLDSPQSCVRRFGFFALQNLTSSLGNCRILRQELGDTFTPLQCALTSRSRIISGTARCCMVKITSHGKVSVPPLLSLSLSVFSEYFGDIWQEHLHELPLELQQRVNPFNYDFLPVN